MEGEGRGVINRGAGRNIIARAKGTRDRFPRLKPIDLYPDLELSLHATSKKKRGTRSVSLVVVAVATDSDIPWPRISVRLRM